MGRTNARPLRVSAFLLLLVVFVCHAKPLARERRRTLGARPLGQVLLPLNGAVFSPSEAFHFQYAMGSRSGGVKVELVSVNESGAEELRIPVSLDGLGIAENG